MELAQFYKNKKVFLTGHTGFKGTWLTIILSRLGAKVCGYSLSPEKQSLFNQTRADKLCQSVIGDINDFDKLYKTFSDFKPEIVIHMAAQPLVLEGYKTPQYTYQTNVMGTVNILECVRLSGGVKSVLNVTTDKVYRNNEWVWGYREDDVLDGYDPYSNSKSCSELVTSCYKKSFFDAADIRVSTARSGNVIGGGDYSANRIIPDCVRAASSGTPIEVRNPHSTRPYQHVLEPLFMYLTIAMRQYEDAKYCGSYNIGPDDCDCVTTGQLVTIFCEKWGGINWINKSLANAPHEANFLKLDNSKVKKIFGFKPVWHIDKAVEKSVVFAKVTNSGDDIMKEVYSEIDEFIQDGGY